MNRSILLQPDGRSRAVRRLLLAAAVFAAARPLTAQENWTLPEAARWLETTGTDLAISSTDPTAANNFRMVGLTARATLNLTDCRLTIVVTDNSGVSGTTTTMQVPLAEVDAPGVRPVSRPDGYNDFIYIPGQFFVTIPARSPETYPFLTGTSRGELRSYLATIPVKDQGAGTTIAQVVQRAATLCGAPPP